MGFKFLCIEMFVYMQQLIAINSSLDIRIAQTLTLLVTAQGGEYLSSTISPPNIGGATSLTISQITLSSLCVNLLSNGLK